MLNCRNFKISFNTRLVSTLSLNIIFHKIKLINLKMECKLIQKLLKFHFKQLRFHFIAINNKYYTYRLYTLKDYFTSYIQIRGFLKISLSYKLKDHIRNLKENWWVFHDKNTIILAFYGKQNTSRKLSNKFRLISKFLFYLSLIFFCLHFYYHCKKEVLFC